MKSDIHPQYYPKAKVTCSCGGTFEVGSTSPEIQVELCSSCHPFFTGKQKYIDTAGRIDRFKAKLQAKETIAKKVPAEGIVAEKNKSVDKPKAPTIPQSGISESRPKASGKKDS